MRILGMHGLGRPLCVIGFRGLLLVSSVAVSVPVSAQRLSAQSCGTDSLEARFAVRKWLASGGVRGITTLGADSLQLLTDGGSKEVCAVLNAYRVSNHEPPRTIFRLGNYYLAFFSRPLAIDTAGNLRIDESDGVVVLFSLTYTTLAIGHTKASEILRRTKSSKGSQRDSI